MSDTTTTRTVGFSKLFMLAQYSFDKFVRECESYGINASPNLKLELENGVELSYYSFEDGNIHASLPDLGLPLGKLYKLALRDLLHCESDRELVDFLNVFIPRLIAHELGHHFRHQYGLFDFNNLWNEEQIANNLAVALTQHRLLPEQKERTLRLLQRATEGIAEKLGADEVGNIATDSYYNVLDALNAAGKIADTEIVSANIMQALFSINPEDVLKSSGQLSREMEVRLANRDDIIEEINEQYDTNSLKYLYYHLGWFYCDLTGQENHYVGEFAQRHLNLDAKLLPTVTAVRTASEQQIRACYQAARDVEAWGAGRRYFYRRYRSLLVTKLHQDALHSRSQSTLAKPDFPLLLEGWTEDEVDRLNYMAPLLSPEARKLFPEYIGHNGDDNFILPDHLPSETDRRLWEHLVHGEKDTYARNTLTRLNLLEQTAMCRALPAEVLLEIAHVLYEVRLEVNETIIWTGEKNKDVFILIDGELEVTIQDNGNIVVGTVKEGDMFGEMAFVTHETRSASVTAKSPSTCFVLRAADLNSIAHAHPTILMQMARTLAERLAVKNKSVEAGQSPFTV